MTAISRVEILLLMEWARLSSEQRMVALAYVRQLASRPATDPTGN